MIGMVMKTNHDLSREVLETSSEFRKSWLSVESKNVAPFPVNREITGDLTRRMHSGSRATGAELILVGSLEESRAEAAPVFIPASEEGSSRWRDGVPLIAVAENLTGALLFPRSGHALIAGSARFLENAVPEGVDQVRARFGRYAKKVEPEWPYLREVAKKYPPQSIAWSTPGEVEAGSGIDEQLRLLKMLSRGEMTVSRFAHSWMDARRRSMNSGERVRDPLASLLEKVFFTLEDYPFDPDLREPGDLTDSEVISRVRDLLNLSETGEA